MTHIPKIFYVNGDSFAFGQELDGERNNIDFYHFSEFQRKNCYSGIISDFFNVPKYINESLPGGSNQRVYRTTFFTINNLLKEFEPKDIFVHIGFTENHRREFFINNGYYPHMFTCQPGDSVCKNLWEVMTRNFHGPKGDTEFDFLMIFGVKNFLMANKIPHLLTWSLKHDATRVEEKSHIDSYIIEKFNDKRFYDEFSFNTFCENKFPRGPGHHPLAEGHRAWADNLLKYIQVNNLFDNSDL